MSEVAVAIQATGAVRGAVTWGSAPSSPSVATGGRKQWRQCWKTLSEAPTAREPGQKRKAARRALLDALAYIVALALSSRRRPTAQAAT